ncbi:serine/threonine protein kinase [Argonema galeatum]|uniref:serine/threonine protein kinase n=1 Tax=Argonema galeatum TaxID=2942762 RepID=UPI002010E078|nr:serine/threonine-protein kinase [Argonema galeatum]MCL1467427.1 serine/threonine protein kinase [Argonema galeatum A003/A1]
MKEKIIMCICINPDCVNLNIDLNNSDRYCKSCNNDLLLQNRYRVISLLHDESGYSTIYIVDDAGIEKVLKVLRPHRSKNPRVRYLFRQEADILREMDHSGFPKVDGYFQQKLNNGKILYCIVMEKIEGCNLETYVDNHNFITQEIALEWLEKAVVILNELHRHKYLHRDIKPPNLILRENGELVLIDFGAATRKTFFYGKIYINIIYMLMLLLEKDIKGDGFRAPEQERRYCRYHSDFYSLARCFVYYLTKKSPADDNMYDEKHNLQWRQYTVNISNDLLNLIDKMMAYRIKDRYENGEEILKEIKKIKANSF